MSTENASGKSVDSLGEASHKMYVKEAFDRSSTILATSAAQMARHTLRKEFAPLQMQFCLMTRATVDDLAFEDEDEEMKADGNNNTVSLRFHAAIVQHGLGSELFESRLSSDSSTCPSMIGLVSESESASESESEGEAEAGADGGDII